MVGVAPSAAGSCDGAADRIDNKYGQARASMDKRECFTASLLRERRPQLTLPSTEVVSNSIPDSNAEIYPKLACRDFY